MTITRTVEFFYQNGDSWESPTGRVYPLIHLAKIAHNADGVALLGTTIALQFYDPKGHIKTVKAKDMDVITVLRIVHLDTGHIIWLRLEAPSPFVERDPELVLNTYKPGTRSFAHGEAFLARHGFSD